MKSIWKLKLKVEPKYIVKLSGDNEKAKVFGIAMGITSKEPKQYHQRNRDSPLRTRDG